VDLRPFNLSQTNVQKAANVLDYQPFIITSELQTGVAYSYLHSLDARVHPPLVFHRNEWSVEDWNKIDAANQCQRAMYDAFVEAIAEQYPGGSLLDVACNNGYIPVATRRAGMGPCAGTDAGMHFGESIAFLNEVLGTDVAFHQRIYSPTEPCAPLPRKFDVVCASAILCHLPDPLNFLAYIGSLANEAVFYWGQVVDSEHFLVAYNRPHPSLGGPQTFPYGFNDNTRVSIGLFKYAMESMGFSRLLEVPFKTWIPEDPGDDLESELANASSRHRALLFMRY
jgi:SAM-dependent methyltransferase